ncbi:hypothetical protein GCM10010116_10290 [Microbispora rosea subsp. aerata]|nr:hypothetical protein GCM10010116_10290 [Microbispora rosea subsp. aerata]GLJ83356.1 hypothetical protein GCM10017588_20840 [Microbispora rosea subsp. aerata]
MDDVGDKRPAPDRPVSGTGPWSLPVAVAFDAAGRLRAVVAVARHRQSGRRSYQRQPKPD